MTVEQDFDAWDQFPVGMRVLAVDDDQTCLRILETLLHHCQYHVTTTNQAQTALDLLRDNKNKFDLVISDVDMPDMDGFKLLEHVGLEMDLPVIMLSAHSDPKYVMKGITHGACDYLLKPVRMEELKNIWQHVVRRRKFDKKSSGSNADGKDGSGNVSGNEAAGNSDQNNMKVNRKRKDQYEDDEDDKDENGRENDDPTASKKPRVVWTVELHRKFVAAVNQLGIDKAVPKKILDLMNVDKLTRENVASHLQKYRLYLKRISCVANQQANMAAVLGSTDQHFLQMSSLNGLGGFHRTMAAGSGQFQGGPGMRSFPPNGILGRFNSPAGLGVRNLSSSGMFLQTPTDIGKFQQVSSHPVSHTSGGNILQGLPMPLDLDQLQSNNNNNNNSNHHRGITGTPAAFPSLPTQNPLISAPNNLLVLEGHPQQTSPTGTSLNSGFSSHFSGDQINRRLEHWSSAVSSALPPANIAQNVVSTMPSQNGNSTNQFDVSSVSSSGHPVHLQHSKANNQEWNTQNNSSLNYPNPFCHSSASLSQSLDPNSRTFYRNSDFDSNTQQQPELFDSLHLKQPDIVGPATDALLSNNTKEGFLTGQQKLQSGFMAADAGYLDAVVNSTMKQEQNQTDLTGGDLGFGGFSSLGTCL